MWVTLGIKCVLYIFLLMICLNNSDTLFFTGYMLSRIHIIFTAFFALITSCKYTILKKVLEENNKHKFMYAILIVVSFFIVINSIYIIVPKSCEINDWYINSIDEKYSCVDEQLADFVFLPQYHDSINILKMTTFETIFSLGLVAIAFIREKTKKGNIAYILERILKVCFRYSIIIIFLIYLLTIPNKYLLVGKWKNIGIGLLFCCVIVFVIKNYLALKSCYKKNKNKYGKENLIVVVTQTNYVFCLKDYIINPLLIFHKFDTKNLVKSLLVDGKKYSFVSYDALRYNLININQYKNVAYLIILKGQLLQMYYDDNYGTDFVKKIDEIAQSGNNFLIYQFLPKVFTLSTADKIKEKYAFRYVEKLSIRNVLDIVNLTEKSDILKMNSKKLLDYITRKEIENYVRNKFEHETDESKIKAKEIEIWKKIYSESEYERKKNKYLFDDIKEEKNEYIKYGLNVILNSFNYVEYLYTLLKICEYIIHYMALKNVIDNPKEIQQKDVESGTLASWRNCISFNKKYSGNNTEKIDDIASEQDIINSIIEIREILAKEQKETVDKNVEHKNEYFFKDDICQIVIDIRNILLAHGVITYSVSEEIVHNLFNIVFILVKEFEELNITIHDDEKIKYIFEEEISAIYKKNNNELFLYSDTVKQRKQELYKECLNYETGKRYVIDKKVTLNTDTIYSKEQIEKDLEKWVIK